MAPNPNRFPDTPWHFRAEDPRLPHYSTKAANPDALAELETSLRDIGEYQRRLWANREKAPSTGRSRAGCQRQGQSHPHPGNLYGSGGFSCLVFRATCGDETRHDFLWRVTPIFQAWAKWPRSIAVIMKR